MNKKNALPKGWKERRLNDVVIFLDGKRKPIKSEDRIKIKGSYPYYGATGIIDYVNDYLFDDTLILMGEDGENILSRSLPHVFVIEGKVWVNNHAHVLKTKTSVNTIFLANYLESLDYKKYNTGSAQPKLNKKTCEDIIVLLPPLPEQKKIASILSTWDRAIKKTEALLKNSEDQLKALMQQLLTDKKRLPGFIGEWNVFSLNGIASSFGGLLGKQKDDFGEGSFYVPYINVFNNSYVDIKALERVKISPNERQNTLKYGDILFTSSSETPEEVGMSSVCLDELEDCYLNSFCFAYRLNNFGIMTPEFARFLFRGENMRRKISKLAQGATRYNLSKNKLGNLLFALPPLPEQKAIASVLTTAQKEVDKIKEKLARLKLEKSALMQQLLTGKRRVSDV